MDAGGLQNDTLKITMFDVSDLENPKELFSKELSIKGANSTVTYDQKACFCNKDKNLIGFPFEAWGRKELSYGLVLFHIDYENNKFDEIDNMISSYSFSSDYNVDCVNRGIYIGDKIYLLYNYKIEEYDFENYQKINEIELDRN